ncbi:AAA family ATPase [Sorangium sp. So ce1153]|uniref:AAA family ATPase n=1 Tax=Sorangium sp. So ce1153 TaxID=3133333 RepID=UPI003F644087
MTTADAGTQYRPLFDPTALAQGKVRPERHVPYVYEPGLTLAVNVAMAANRPLLLRGAPGSGKSTLAADVAWRLGWRFDPVAVTSKTQAQTLGWRFDAVRRLADAYNDALRSQAQDAAKYVEPGVLWRAFDPDLARTYGAAIAPDDPRSVVVLLDEIDKADPDVPNDLLMVLDQRWFRVSDLPDRVVKQQEGVQILMIITTNGERELTPAFLRRCVAYDIPEMTDDRLKAIAMAHFPNVDQDLLREVVKLLGELVARACLRRLRKPSAAELVDALQACKSLKIEGTASGAWKAVAETAMWKHKAPEETPGSSSG